MFIIAFFFCDLLKLVSIVDAPVRSFQAHAWIRTSVCCPRQPRQLQPVRICDHLNLNSPTLRRAQDAPHAIGGELAEQYGRQVNKQNSTRSIISSLPQELRPCCWTLAVRKLAPRGRGSARESPLRGIYGKAFRRASRHYAQYGHVCVFIPWYMAFEILN